MNVHDASMNAKTAKITRLGVKQVHRGTNWWVSLGRKDCLLLVQGYRWLCEK